MFLELDNHKRFGPSFGRCMSSLSNTRQISTKIGQHLPTVHEIWPAPVTLAQIVYFGRTLPKVGLVWQNSAKIGLNSVSVGPTIWGQRVGNVWGIAELAGIVVKVERATLRHVSGNSILSTILASRPLLHSTGMFPPAPAKIWLGGACWRLIWPIWSSSAKT